MRRILCALLLWLPLAAAQADEPVSVRIADPYIELHTGPAKGFPIFHVVDRGGAVIVLKRRTDWFKLRTPRGVEGWAHLSQMERTLLLPELARPDFNEATLASYAGRRWEMGIMGGDFGGASALGVYGGYHFTENLSLELALSHALGSYSSSVLAGANVVHQPFPSWRYSPFFTLGAGAIQTDPSATLVDADQRLETYALVGVGVRAYLSRRFLMRLEYKSYVVFTDTDENEEINEWKAGFAFFF